MRRVIHICLCLLAMWPSVTIAQFDEFDQILELPAASRGAALARLAKQGLPLVTESQALFLTQQRGSRPPLLLGDFNWFGRYRQAEGLRGGRMRSVPGTSWFYRIAEFSQRARVEYAFGVDRETKWLDPNNAKSNDTFGSEHSVLTMPGFQPSSWLPAADYKLKGKIEKHLFDDASGEQRQVLVYLPPGADKLSALPAAYFHDGLLYVEKVPTPQLIERMIAAGAIQPLVAVFIDPIDRSVEYRGQPQFLRFFNGELVEFIDEHYPTRAEPSYRAVIGSSRGGMGALAVAWRSKKPAFEMCGMIQPAFTPATEILNDVFQADPRNLRFSLVAGQYDVRFVGDYYRVLDTLLAKGYDVDHWVSPVGHSHNSWQHDMPRMLTRFFAPQ